jgi:hypothetical protein
MNGRGKNARPQRHFKYVSWHLRSECWVVQRRGWLCKGVFSSELQAAKAAATQFGGSVESLRLPRQRLWEHPKQRCPQQRLYKYISWHTSSGCWVARGRLPGDPSPGSHAEQIEAAKLAARARGMPLQDLKLQLKVSPKAPPRQYRNITWHIRSRTWVAQCHGHFLGSSTKQEEAAKVAATTLGVHTSALRLHHDVVQQGPLNDHIIRFQQLWSIYSTADPKEPRIPGDLADLVHRASKPGSEILKEAGLIVPFLLTKYAPHREVMESVYLQILAGSPKADSAELVYDVLAGTLRRLAGTHLRHAWLVNVGRNTTHHGGIIPFANKSLGLLRPDPPKSTPGHDTLCLGQGGRRFAVQPMTNTIRTRLLSLVALGRSLLACKAPRTLHEWANEVQRIEGAIKGPPKVCGFSNSGDTYRARWVTRTWLIWQMRRAGIRCLRLATECAVAHFAKVFPDQQRWILRFAGGRQSLSVKALFQKLKYAGPPEYFSMFTCLWGSEALRKEVQMLGKEWFAQHHAQLVQAVKLV